MVAHLLWKHGVRGSSPLSQTNYGGNMITLYDFIDLRRKFDETGKAWEEYTEFLQNKIDKQKEIINEQSRYIAYLTGLLNRPPWERNIRKIW